MPAMWRVSSERKPLIADVTGVLLCWPPFMSRAIPSLIMPSMMRLRLFAAMLSASLWPPYASLRASIASSTICPYRSPRPIVV